MKQISFGYIQYNSPVILTYTFLSLIVLGLSYLTGGVSNTLLFGVYKTSFGDLLGYVRLFTHVLGHISFEHFLNNFITILLVGPMLEEKYGSLNIFMMILFTAFITGIIHIILSDTMLLGASGIAFMLILLSSFTNLKSRKIPLTLIIVAAIFIGQEVYAALASNDNISHFTHIAGGLCGGIFGFFFVNRKGNYLYDKA